MILHSSSSLFVLLKTTASILRFKDLFRGLSPTLNRSIATGYDDHAASEDGCIGGIVIELKVSVMAQVTSPLVDSGNRCFGPCEARGNQ